MGGKLDNDDATSPGAEEAGIIPGRCIARFFLLCLMRHPIQHRLLVCMCNLHQIGVPCRGMLICIVLCHAV